MTIFQKEYDGESSSDASRDIVEAFDPSFNPLVNSVPQDHNGFQEGTFTITITWEPNH